MAASRSPARSTSRTARISSRASRAASSGASARAPYRDEHDLYALAHAIDWPRHFAPTARCASTSRRRARRCAASSSRRCASRTRCATAFATRGGVRPSIDKRAPDVRVHAHLTDAQATFYLDTSGEPLFKRGYRRDTEEAPLRENLAAGLLALAQWTPGDAVPRSDVRQRHDRHRGRADRGRSRAGARAPLRLPEARVVRRSDVAAHQAGGARSRSRGTGGADAMFASDIAPRLRSRRRRRNLAAAKVADFVARRAARTC